jgi:predicted esterase
MHGVDEPAISEQERANRRALEAMGKALSVRIALPRAAKPCPNQPASLCWGWSFDEGEVDAAVNAVRSAATTCFGAGRPFGLIGFSNGGYLATKLVRTCELHEKLPLARWVVAAGSAMSHGPLEPKPKDLSQCGRLRLLTGTDDAYNFDPSDALLHALEAKHADVRSVRFAGGHTLPEEPTQALVAEMLRAP